PIRRGNTPPPSSAVPDEQRGEGGAAEGVPGSADGVPGAAAPKPPASGRQDSWSSASKAPKAAEPRLSDHYAAPGIGGGVDHDVEWVRFDAERYPAASLEIRYEYRPALVKLGLLPTVRPRDPLQRRERAHGFEPGFAPDPYRPDGGR